MLRRIPCVAQVHDTFPVSRDTARVEDTVRNYSSAFTRPGEPSTGRPHMNWRWVLAIRIRAIRPACDYSTVKSLRFSLKQKSKSRRKLIPSNAGIPGIVFPITSTSLEIRLVPSRWTSSAMKRGADTIPPPVLRLTLLRVLMRPRLMQSFSGMTTNVEPVSTRPR